MKQTHEYAATDIVRSNPGTMQRGAARQWIFALLIAFIVAILLALLGGGMLFMLLRNTGNAFSALLAFLTRTPLLLLIPIIGFVMAFLIALVMARPLALRAYLRRSYISQEGYYQQYIPLTTPVTVRRASDSSTGEAAPAVTTRE